MKHMLLLGMLVLVGCVKQPVMEDPPPNAELSQLRPLCQPLQAPGTQVEKKPVSALEAEIRAALAKRNERLAYEKGRVATLIACNRPALATRRP